MNSFLVIGSFAVLMCLLASPGSAINNTGLPSQQPKRQIVQQQWVLHSLNNVIQTFMNDNQIPGCAIKIQHGGRDIFSYGWGQAILSSYYPTAIDKDRSLFRIASISKTVTAAAILRLVEDGRLTLNDRVFGQSGRLNQYVWQSNVNAGTADKRLLEITIRQLLQHTGGWDRDIGGDPLADNGYIAVAYSMNVYPPLTNDHFIRWLVKQKLDFNPGQRFAYSNVGYMLLGEIISKVSGKTYENYVKQDILAGIGISDMRLGKTREHELAPNEVHYYSNAMSPSMYNLQIGNYPVFQPYTGFPLENNIGSAGWIASMPDLVKFIHALSGTSGQTIFRNANSFGIMKAKPSYKGDNAEEWYGMGLMVSKQGLKYGHEGTDPGSRAIMSHDNTGFNFAFACNKLPRDQDVDTIVRYAMSLERNLQPNYFTVKDNNFNSITNGNYAVKTNIREQDMHNFRVSVALSDNRWRMARIEAVAVSGTGMLANPCIAPVRDYFGRPLQPISLGYQLYYTTTWVKDNIQSSWNTQFAIDDAFLQTTIANLLATGWGIKYMTTHLDAQGIRRHTIITVPMASSEWQVLTGLDPPNHYAESIRQLKMYGRKIVTQHITGSNGNGMPLIMSLHTTKPTKVPLFKVGMGPQAFQQSIEHGMVPTHVSVSSGPGGFPLFNAIFSQTIRSMKFDSRIFMSQRKLEVALLDEALADRVPITIPGYEQQGVIVYAPVWISRFDLENNY